MKELLNKGYIFNTLLVTIGSVAGVYLGKKITEKVKEVVFMMLGLITVVIGMKMALKVYDIVPMVICLILGVGIGTYYKIEDTVNDCLADVKVPYFSGKYNTEGFMVASTLFCVGSMTIIGSLKDGLNNDPMLIKTKSVMDGFASMLLASRFGWPVAFSAITVFVVQGLLTFSSKYLTFLNNYRMIGNIDGVGGVIVIAIGLNLLNLKNSKTFDMLPAFLLIIFYGLWLRWGI